MKAILFWASDFLDGASEFAMGCILFAIPFQIGAELIYWWKEASWLGYDLVFFFPDEISKYIESVDAKGAQAVLTWLTEIWVAVYSVPLALIVGFVFTIVGMAIRPNEGEKI